MSKSTCTVENTVTKQVTWLETQTNESTDKILFWFDASRNHGRFQVHTIFKINMHSWKYFCGGKRAHEAEERDLSLQRWLLPRFPPAPPCIDHPGPAKPVRRSKTERCVHSLPYTVASANWGYFCIQHFATCIHGWPASVCPCAERLPAEEEFEDKRTWIVLHRCDDCFPSLCPFAKPTSFGPIRITGRFSQIVDHTVVYWKMQ